MRKSIVVFIVLASFALLVPGCKQLSLPGLMQPKAGKQDSDENARRAGEPSCDLSTLSSSDFSGKNSAWDKIWAMCPASPVAGYNNAVVLMKAGRMDEAAKAAVGAAQLHPTFEPLQLLSRRLNDPYGYVGFLADAKLKRWLASEGRLQFTLKPPTKASPPPLPELVKGEFEKKSAFEARVAAAKKSRSAQLRKIENNYEAEVQAFNKAVAKHNLEVEKEEAARKAAIPGMRIKFLAEAMSEVLGDPMLADPVYDSESEKFYARLTSTTGVVSEKVSISVPLAQGRDFKRQIASVKPVVPYELKDGRLVRGVPEMVLGKRTYPAMFTDETYSPVVMTAMADVSVGANKPISTMKVDKVDMSAAMKEDAAYFGDALSTQDDPRLAKLRQQQAENNRKLQEARNEQAREAEAKRIEAQIAEQQKLLEALGGSAGKEYEGLKEKRQWNFKRASHPAVDTVAVVIGNRSYQRGIPMVPYAYNDAKAVRQFLMEGLGVPQENILYREDATKGEMEGLFRRTLPNRVERGRTDVLVYFSGHGMPVDSKALLLPSDASPDTADITGYSRDTMLTQLAALNAKSVTVILDACFSGTAKGGETLTAGKPVYKKPEGAVLPQNTVLISASRANQISRMDEDAGMSLMTLYLLEGLSGDADGDGNKVVSVEELRGYLEREVSRAARLSFDMDQEPEVLGPVSRELVAY